MTKQGRSPITRRRFLIGAAATAGAAVLGACTSQPTPAPTAAPKATSAPVSAPSTAPVQGTAVPATAVRTSNITRGGVLREIDRLAISSLDPHLSTTRDTAWMPLLFDTLLSYRVVDLKKEEFAIGPGLAESYEVVDPTTIEFKLVKGVKFHDGSDFNAEVAKWNLERAATHEKSAVAETVKDVKEVVAVDSHTLRIILNAPAPMFPLQMTPANPVTVFMVSKAAVEKQGDAGFAEKPVGSGPMQFKEWVRDDRLVMEKFPDHWEMGEDGKPLPYVDGFVSRLITDQSVGLVEMRTGHMDIFLNLLLEDVETVKAEPQLKLFNVPGRWMGYPSLYFNPHPPEGADYPFSKHLELREAAQYATDRQALADTLGFGNALPHYYWDWYPGSPGYDESLPRREFDLEKAKELVAKAGFANGVDVEVKVINRTSDTAPLEVLQAMWAKAGIRLHINKMDRLVWVDDGRAGKFEALSHSNTGQPDPILRQTTRTGSTYNWANYSDPEMDKLWEQVAAEYDAKKREEIYRQMQTKLYNEAYHFIGYRMPTIAALNKAVQGMTTNYNYRYIWLQS